MCRFNCFFELWCIRFYDCVLKPLHELTDILSAEKSVSVSVVKPLVQHICEKILVCKGEDADLTKDMKERIKCDLLQRYNDPDVDELLTICSFVDPRFKKRISENAHLVAIDAIIKRNFWKILKITVLSLYNWMN